MWKLNMVQRATGFGTTAAARPERGRNGARATAQGEVASRAIPLMLAPLLSPYKKKGRLSLRIERLPHLARLSNGRNNGDHSWSLTLDELEDLAYLPPDGMNEAHTLALRVVSLNGGDGTTLAVLDVPISSDSPVLPREVPEAKPGPRTQGASLQLQRLNDELAKAKTALATREAELAELRQNGATEQAASRRRADAELAAAREAWQAELEERLAAAAKQAASQLNQYREWEAEQKARLAQSQDQARQALAASRERAQQETQKAVLAAEAKWKSEEAARFAAAEAQWRAQSAKAAADARAEAEAARQEHDLSNRRLRNELADLRTRLAERDAALREQQSALANAREAWTLERDAALSEAEKSWAAGEAARLSANAAQSQQQVAHALAEMTSRCETAERALAEMRAQQADHSDGELRRLRLEAETAKTSLANRESEVAQLRLAVEAAQERAQKEMQAALSQAKAAWTADEAVRLAAAEAQGRQQSAAALAEARTQLEAAETTIAQLQAQAKPPHAVPQDTDIDFWRREIASLRATLGEREIELAKVRSALDRARASRLPESEIPPNRPQIRSTLGRPGRERDKPVKRNLVRDAAVAGFFAILAIVFIPESWQDKLFTMMGGVPASTSASAKPAAPKSSGAAPAPVQMAVVTRVAKLRAGPSTTAATISKLQRGMEVATLEQRGDWTLVRLNAASGAAKPQQGWVFSSYLKDAGGSDTKTPAANHI